MNSCRWWSNQAEIHLEYLDESDFLMEIMIFLDLKVGSKVGQLD